MSIVKGNDKIVGSDFNFTAFSQEQDRARRQGVSLTNYTNSSAPQIEAGSIWDIAGTQVYTDANTSIDGWSGISNDSDVYIYTYFDSGTSTYKAEYTTTAPTWNPAYQGFYGTGGTALYRYIGSVNFNYFEIRKDGSGNYANKRITNKENFELYGNGKCEIADETTINGAIISTIGRRPAGVNHATAKTQDQTFQIFDSLIPNTGDRLLVNGSFGDNTLSYVERTSSTTMTFYGSNTSTAFASLITSGNTSAFLTTGDSISW